MSQNLIAKWSAGLILATIPLTSMAQTPTASARLPTSNNPALKLNGNLGLAPLLSAQEQVDFEAISARYDRRIIAAIEKNPARKTAMETELRAIASEANNAKKEEMIKAYQARHGASYRQALQDGRIDLATMATELNSKISGLEFRVTDGLTMSAIVKKAPIEATNFALTSPVLKGDTNTNRSTLSSPRPVPQKTVKSLVSADYSRPESLSCGPIAGSDVSFDGGYLTNKTFAAVAGGCNNDAAFEYNFEIPPNQKLTVDITVGLQSKASAVGIVSFAASNARSVVFFKEPTSVRDDNFHARQSQYTYFCYAIAPVLWSSSETCGNDNVVISRTFYNNDIYPIPYILKVRADTKAGTFGAGSFASAEARVIRLRTTITTEPLN